jgi:hypothetical protein
MDVRVVEGPAHSGASSRFEFGGILGCVGAMRGEESAGQGSRPSVLWVGLSLALLAAGLYAGHRAYRLHAWARDGFEATAVIDYPFEDRDLDGVNGYHAWVHVIPSGTLDDLRREARALSDKIDPPDGGRCGPLCERSKQQALASLHLPPQLGAQSWEIAPRLNTAAR